jgi:hypothetical protein
MMITEAKAVEEEELLDQNDNLLDEGEKRNNHQVRRIDIGPDLYSQG